MSGSAMDDQQVLVKCGGFSTQLAKHVGEQVDGDPLWGSRFDFTNPTAVIQTHLDYLQNGAQIILTNTYQSSVEGFMKHLKLSYEESVDLIAKSVQHTKAAKEKYLATLDKDNVPGNLPLIMASIGPYGAYLHDGSEYDGSYAACVTKQQLKDWHRVRIDACLKEGVDGLAIETIPILLEAEALVEMLLQEYKDVEFWVSFQCKDEQHLAHGENFADAALKIWQLVKCNNALDRLYGIGVNCVHPKFVSPLFKSLHAASTNAAAIPLVVYSNRGETYDAERGEWTGREQCIPLEQYVPEWLQLGAKIIGGCCRVYPEDIQRIRNCIDNIGNNN